jgi:hypothetical protein
MDWERRREIKLELINALRLLRKNNIFLVIITEIIVRNTNIAADSNPRNATWL